MNREQSWNVVACYVISKRINALSGSETRLSNLYFVEFYVDMKTVKIDYNQ